MRRHETHRNSFQRLAFLILAIVAVAALTAGLSVAGAQNPHDRPLAVFDVYVDDKGDKLATPHIP
ncbi:MAG TPA: hypothetical protein VEX60_09980 [Pyrinomonadaceae bacterium]|nr:hypothetical protein [Pyrinomonadaceae bacterium]